MTLFAIGDLHLPGGEEKPMDIFGDHWENHFAHIAADWRTRVKDGDVVLIPGDISWAMQLERAVPDLQKIGALPGRDICLFCLKEMNAQAAESVGAASDDSGDGDGEQVTPRSLTDMDDVGSMDEIQMLPEETDSEYTKMAGEMTSLEGMQEDEANEDDDEDADDDM